MTETAQRVPGSPGARPQHCPLSELAGEEVLDALQYAAAGQHTDPERTARSLAAQSAPSPRTLLGDVDITEYEQESLDLSHSGTGIDLSVFGDEVSITVPYWHAGDAAAAALGKVFALSKIVERETGLTAYDPQMELPVADMTPQHSAALMSRITGDLRSRHRA